VRKTEDDLVPSGNLDLGEVLIAQAAECGTRPSPVLM